VFEPFFTTKGPGAGSGLGLAVVHAIMRELEGTVTLESKMGHGTVVRCFFPSLESEILPVRQPGAGVQEGHGERILFVDDEPALVRVGERRLSGLHYHVAAETEPEQALKRFLLDPQAFDLVITDFTMPKMTGLDFAEALVKVRADIPILMVTGFVEDIEEERLRAAGIRRVLRKPLTLEQLSTAIREAIDG
jgi:CheY-like chemotaxis protein